MNSGFNPNNDCPICGGPAGHYVPQGCIRIALAKVEALAERVTALESYLKHPVIEVERKGEVEIVAQPIARHLAPLSVSRSDKAKEVWRKRKEAQTA